MAGWVLTSAASSSATSVGRTESLDFRASAQRGALGHIWISAPCLSVVRNLGASGSGMYEMRHLIQLENNAKFHEDFRGAYAVYQKLSIPLAKPEFPDKLRSGHE